jgi:hypothetical protein
MSGLRDVRIKNVSDLALLIEQLSRAIERTAGSGPLSVREAQQAAISLTRLQLLLNDLERAEAQERGTSIKMSERFFALGSRIREMWTAVRDGQRTDACRKKSTCCRAITEISV